MNEEMNEISICRGMRDFFYDELFKTPQCVSNIWYSVSNIWYDKTRGYTRILRNVNTNNETAQLDIRHLSFVHAHVTRPKD